MRKKNQMRSAQEIELYLNTIIKEGLFSNKSRLKFYMDTLFEGITLEEVPLGCMWLIFRG